MKNISLFILYGLLLILSFNTAATTSDTTVKGLAYFKCNFLSAYMEKHGYYLIKEDSETDLFAAEDAEVIIKNTDNAVVGVGKTDKKGNFYISVPKENSYRIIVRFHGHEIEDVVSYSEAKNFIADMGYFSTEKVGNWIDAKLGLR